MAKKDENTLGRAAVPKGQTFVMTERAAHDAWARLIMDNPTAARLMHVIVARIGAQNVLVISQSTLAKLMKCSKRTIQRAVSSLVTDRWIQRVCIGGTVNGYIVNDQVVWCERQAQRQYSVFSAVVVANADDQKPEDLQPRTLRRLPMVYPPDEVVLLHGEGEKEVTGRLPGMEATIEGNLDPTVGLYPDLDQPDMCSLAKRKEMS